jgi:hypothetical protein
MFKTHFFWFIYVITILCAGGWYIHEQKQTIAEQEKTIQELTVSQREPIIPKKRKVKVIESEIDKNLVCKDVIDKFKSLKDQCLQCAYQLKFYQEKEKALQNMEKEDNGTGDNN